MEVVEEREKLTIGKLRFVDRQDHLGSNERRIASDLLANCREDDGIHIVQLVDLKGTASWTMLKPEASAWDHVIPDLIVETEA